MTSEAGMEQVSLSDARAWWPDRPILRALPPPPPVVQEAAIVWSVAGGRKGDPRSAPAELDLVYQRADRPVQNEPVAVLYDETGLIRIKINLAACSTGASTQGTVVVVRGRSGRLIEGYRGKNSDQNLRAISYSDALPDGRCRYVQVRSSSTYY